MRYDIRPQELGAGGFGRVFLARDRQAENRKVAIKKIVASSRSARETVEKEVLIMKDLDHPSIIKIFDSYDHGRTVYLVMEYCEGGDLLERMREQLLEEHSCVDIIRQVASALQFAHGCGIAHRDLKPENVCLCSRDPADNRVKVIDWGVGYCFGAKGRLGKMCSAVGSVVYAAPEVLKGSGSYTASCDLWSLGVMTFAMLCGHLPFSGESGGQLHELVELRCQMSDRAWHHVSEEAKDFVRALLVVNPTARLDVDSALHHPWLVTGELSCPGCRH